MGFLHAPADPDGDEQDEGKSEAQDRDVRRKASDVPDDARFAVRRSMGAGGER
jgi:hypothetical protein